MGFSNVTINRRLHTCVVLVFLMWFHLFLACTVGGEPRDGTLQTGAVTVFQTMARTGSNLVLPGATGVERGRFRILSVLAFAATAGVAYGWTNIEPLSKTMRRDLGVWDLRFGKELTALPHSEMVFRI